VLVKVGTSNPGALAQAEEHIRAALELLPFPRAEAEERDSMLESVPPALPTEPGVAHNHSADYEAQFVSDEPPSNEWLLGDDDSFDLG
jgi:hypothetical protein